MPIAILKPNPTPPPPGYNSIRRVRWVNGRMPPLEYSRIQANRLKEKKEGSNRWTSCLEYKSCNIAEHAQYHLRVPSHRLRLPASYSRTSSILEFHLIASARLLPILVPRLRPIPRLPNPPLKPSLLLHLLPRNLFRNLVDEPDKIMPPQFILPLPGLSPLRLTCKGIDIPKLLRSYPWILNHREKVETYLVGGVPRYAALQHGNDPLREVVV